LGGLFFDQYLEKLFNEPLFQRRSGKFLTKNPFEKTTSYQLKNSFLK
jgi:hypothetical protein